MAEVIRDWEWGQSGNQWQRSLLGAWEASDSGVRQRLSVPQIQWRLLSGMEPVFKITLLFAPTPTFLAENRWGFGSRADWQRLLDHIKERWRSGYHKPLGRGPAFLVSSPVLRHIQSFEQPCRGGCVGGGPH